MKPIKFINFINLKPIKALPKYKETLTRTDLCWSAALVIKDS